MTTRKPPVSRSDLSILLNMGRCKLCGDVLVSLSLHDFKSCKCGKSFLDGGNDYIRAGGDMECFCVTTQNLEFVLNKILGRRKEK